MTIDWFTLVAQIVNFLILVVLLRWFLYGPIVQAMEQRESEIAARMKRAEQSQREGEEQAREYEKKLLAIEGNRAAVLKEAMHEADLQRQQLEKEAREEVQRRRLEWFQAFERETDELLSELLRRAGSLSAHASRRTLAQLADIDLEQRMFAAFANRLSDLDDERRAEIETLLKNSRDTVFVRSAFEVSSEWRERLHSIVCGEFGYEGDIDFELAPDLICGIELETGGYSFGWNINEFLEEMENEFTERLKTGEGSLGK